MCGKRNNVNGKATHNKNLITKQQNANYSHHMLPLSYNAAPPASASSHSLNTASREAGAQLWNTTPTKLETQNRHSCGGGVIFAHSVSLGPSLVLHRSDAVTDVWLGAKLAL